MGYRSTIYIKALKKDKEELLDILKASDLDEEFEEDTIEEPDEYIRFVADGLKWYSSYEDVTRINNWVEDNENRGLIAVGEDNYIKRFGNPSAINMWEAITIEW